MKMPDLPPITGRSTIVVQNEHELVDLVAKEMASNGPNCDLNHLDVSRVKVFDRLFKDSPFNGDISRWDVSSAKTMQAMFQDALFNGDISEWDVSKVKVMRSMFQGAAFNGDISKWNVENLIKANFMFMDSQFSGNVSKWRALDMSTTDRMFATPAFHGDLSDWQLRTYCEGQGMVLSTFNGVLPSVQFADHYSSYTVLIGGVDALNLHLRRTLFSHVHADCFLWDEEKSKVWATPEILRWARAQTQVGNSFGMDHDALRDLMLTLYHAKPAMALDLPANAFDSFEK